MNILNAVNLELPYGLAAGIRLVNTAWHLAEAGANVNFLAGISPSSDQLRPAPYHERKGSRGWAKSHISGESKFNLSIL